MSLTAIANFYSQLFLQNFRSQNYNPFKTLSYRVCSRNIIIILQITASWIFL